MPASCSTTLQCQGKASRLSLLASDMIPSAHICAIRAGSLQVSAEKTRLLPPQWASKPTQGMACSE